LNLDVSDTTVDAWELILQKAYDEDLPGACVEVLETWETTFLPPPGIILKASMKRTHARMIENIAAADRLSPAETKAWVARLRAAAAKEMN
jgi:hypothetical protein